MKIPVVIALLASSGLCMAQEVGRVISSTPVQQQVAVPRQVCSTELVNVQQPKSGAGAAMGAIAGGAVGNAIGNGGGRAAATVIGILGGAILGDNMEGNPPGQVQNVQRCGVQNFYENRTVAYNVVYEYAGKQYAVQMPNDPGPSIQLQVTPTGMSNQSPDLAPQAQYLPPGNGVMTAPAQPIYYAQPYYPPVSIEVGPRYWGHHYHRPYGY
jgi:uncharacterized protein YcfJ